MRTITFVAAAAAMAALTSTAAAQSFPDRPVRLIVPFNAGGPNDTVARLIAPRLAEELGQPVVVENRSGAGGVVGTDAMATAEPDGHVIGISSAGALAISSSVQAQMPYVTLEDLRPVTLVGTVPELLVATPSLGVADFAALLEWARENPGQLEYASSGPGGMQHLAGEMLNMAADINALHIPYGGAAPAVTDLLAGEVKMMFADLPVLLAHVESGGLIPMAVGSPERAALLPDVPTMAELGLPEVVAENWYGIVAPAGIPDEVLATLSAAFTATLTDPAVAASLAAQGINVVASTPEEFAAYIAAETAKWAEVVASSGAIQQ